MKQNKNKLLPNIIRRKEAVEVNNADDSLLSSPTENLDMDSNYSRSFSERTSKIGGEFSNSSTAGSILDESYYSQCEVYERTSKLGGELVSDQITNTGENTTAIKRNY